jgi:hypothetical protein
VRTLNAGLTIASDPSGTTCHLVVPDLTGRAVLAATA